MNEHPQLSSDKQPLLVFAAVNVVLVVTGLLCFRLRTMLDTLFVLIGAATVFAVLGMAWRLNKENSRLRRELLDLKKSGLRDQSKPELSAPPALGQ